MDSTFDTGDIAWCPQIYDQNRWIVKLDEVSINGTTAFTNQLALIDTGTALINTSPTTFDQVQAVIPGNKLLSIRRMFAYPESSLKGISYVFAAREFKLTAQDLSLGRVKQNAKGYRYSSICRTGTGSWPFPENVWVLGGIHLDDLVTIFDSRAEKVGFATISEGNYDCVIAQ